jgi:hypothetical protein
VIKAIQASRVHQAHQARQVRQAQGVQQVHLLDLRRARLEIALKEWGRLGGLVSSCQNRDLGRLPIPRTFPKLWTALCPPKTAARCALVARRAITKDPVRTTGSC